MRWVKKRYGYSSKAIGSRMIERAARAHLDGLPFSTSGTRE